MITELLGIAGFAINSLPTIAILGVAGMVFTGHGDDLMKFGAGALGGLADTLDGILGKDNEVSKFLRGISGEKTQEQVNTEIDGKEVGDENVKYNENTQSASENLNDVTISEAYNNDFDYSMPGLSQISQRGDAQRIGQKMAEQGWETTDGTDAAKKLEGLWLEACKEEKPGGLVGVAAGVLGSAKGFLFGDDPAVENIRQRFSEKVINDGTLRFNKSTADKSADVQDIVQKSIEDNDELLMSEHNISLITKELQGRGAYTIDGNGNHVPVTQEQVEELLNKTSASLPLKTERVLGGASVKVYNFDSEEQELKMKSKTMFSKMNEMGIQLPDQMPSEKEKTSAISQAITKVIQEGGAVMPQTLSEARSKVSQGAAEQSGAPQTPTAGAALQILSEKGIEPDNSKKPENHVDHIER